ncbi:hypothetical protein FRC07_012858, partial [Ceratobasidium sp. 392]
PHKTSDHKTCDIPECQTGKDEEACKHEQAKRKCALCESTNHSAVFKGCPMRTRAKLGAKDLSKPSPSNPQTGSQSTGFVRQPQANEITVTKAKPNQRTQTNEINEIYAKLPHLTTQAIRKKYKELGLDKALTLAALTIAEPIANTQTEIPQPSTSDNTNDQDNAQEIIMTDA